MWKVLNKRLNVLAYLGRGVLFVYILYEPFVLSEYKKVRLRIKALPSVCEEEVALLGNIRQ